MWATLATAFTLLIGPASAADQGPAQSVEWHAPLAAEDPVDKIGGELDKMKSEAEKKREERLAKLEELNKGKAARVVVLKVEDTDHDNEVLQRNVKARISRPDAKFYPDVDLYQQGRKEPDKSIRPVEQRAFVPEETFAVIDKAIAETEILDWDDLDETGWGLRAADLRNLANELWFMDRIEVRLPLFKLYAQIGRSANNMNNTAPPFFEQVGDQPVNYYFYLAAALAHQEPSLLSEVTHEETKENIKYYFDQLGEGAFPMMKLSFELSGDFSPEDFATEFTAWVNGKDELISSVDGLFEVPPGRVDIYLERSDGHSMSHRLELDKFDENIFFLRDEARKKMGIGFAEQLLDHPNECIPLLDGEVLTYLNIYAKLHLDAEIYIAVPPAGNPNKTYLWRFDHASGTLFKVLDDTGGFPVRFALMVGSGAIFSGATLGEPGVDPTDFEPPTGGDVSDLIKPTMSAIPVEYQLRAHYIRLMAMFGMQWGVSISGDYIDFYQVNDNSVRDASDQEAFKTRGTNTLIYGGVGFMLGKEAPNGFGWRGYIRSGLYNVPHAVDLTLHGGTTIEAPFSSSSGRVRPIIDADAYGGVMIPVKSTLLSDTAVIPTFGVSAAAGLTF
jgi:hypothetical protein